MTDAHSLRDLIIQEAGELFRENGYKATTIKQIAKAAGCTTAALYYHFEAGKEHILREVIHKSAEESALSISLPEAACLEEFLVELAGILAERLPEMTDRFNWIMLQFATLPDEEKRILQNQVIGVQHALREQVGQYVAGEATADQIAWMILCSFFGYRQLLVNLDIGRLVKLSLADYASFLAQVIGKSYE